MKALLQQLQERAQSRPHSPLLESADRVVTVDEFLAQLRDVGSRLRRGGHRTVALYADNGPEWVVLDLACQTQGVCLVPIPTFFTPQQIEHVIRSAGVDLLVYQDTLSSQLPPGLADSGAALSLVGELKALPMPASQRPRIPQGTTKITFTSGSTGEPKGVCLSLSNCLKVARSLAEATGLREPRHLCVLPLPVLLENIAGVYAPLLVDGQVLTIPLEQLGFSGSSGLDPMKFLAALDRYRPNTLILVPQLLTVLDMALSLGWEAPDSLEFIAVGGARVSASMVARVRQRGLPVYEGYGLSECASVVSLNSPGFDRPGTSGRVLNHVSVTEEGGQLRVGGNTFLGYLNQPDSWGAEFVDTGDVGTLDADGYITIEGRAKNLLISSYGRNVSPEWVESEISGTGLFRQVVVFGDGRPYCVALVWPLDENCTDAAIDAAIGAGNAALPDYARVAAWARLPRPLSSDEGLLTANGRPRRDPIEQAHGPLIDSLYPHERELKSL